MGVCAQAPSVDVQHFKRWLLLFGPGFAVQVHLQVLDDRNTTSPHTVRHVRATYIPAQSPSQPARRGGWQTGRSAGG
jgi:hypothetical protein